MSTIRVVNLQHTDATEPNIVLEADGTAVFASGITISGGTNLTVSGTAEFASGTVSAPGVTFIDDNNTGLYSPAADTVAITTAATERLRVDSSGKVGIGTTSPSAQIESEGNVSSTTQFSGFQGLRIQNANGAAHGVTADINFVAGTGSNNRGAVIGAEFVSGTNGNDLYFATNGSSVSSNDTPTERMRIDSSGRVGIGTTTPTRTLTVQGDMNLASGSTIESDSSAGTLQLQGGSTYPGGTILMGGGSGNNDIRFSTNVVSTDVSATERMRIDSSGTLVIGRTTSSDPNRYVQIHNGSAASSCYFQSTNTGTGSGASDGIVMGMGDATNAYFWNYEAGALVFAASANERMRIDSAGNVGIGTSAPTHPLEVRGSNTQINFSSSATGGGYLMSTNAGQWCISGGVRYNGAGWYARHTSSSFIRDDGDGIMKFYTNTGNTVDAYITPAQRMQITSAGKVVVSSTTYTNHNSAQFLAVGDGATTPMATYAPSTASYTNIHFRNPNGNVGSITTLGSATSYNTSSDYRLKENVIDISDGITRVKQLSPKRFNFIVDDTTTVDGFLAHEAQTVVPEAVTGEKDGEEMQGIDQSKLIPLLTAALQEAIAKIETLEQRLSDAGIA